MFNRIDVIINNVQNIIINFSKQIFHYKNLKGFRWFLLFLVWSSIIFNISRELHPSSIKVSASTLAQTYCPPITLPEFKLPWDYDWNSKIYFTSGPHSYHLGGLFTTTYLYGEGSGLDFAAGKPFTVAAMAGGEIVDAKCDYSSGLGCTISIKHDIGTSFMTYGHLDGNSQYFKNTQLKLTTKQKVLRGDPIAISGATGTGSGGRNHLHIELRDGSPYGFPIGWECIGYFGGQVDGYWIWGYAKGNDYGIDPYGNRVQMYNYDGVAVKGDINQYKVIHNFSFIDQLNPLIVHNDVTTIVGVNFPPCGGKVDCEINTGPGSDPDKNTQFAKVAGGGFWVSANLLSSQDELEALSTGISSGILLSTNQDNSIDTNDNASFISDITLPDGTVVTPGQSLTKTWRLKNTGSSTWGSGYQLVFVDGEQMGAPLATNVATTAPNATIDLSVPLTAPAASGEHTGYFQLRNPQGTYFGPKIWLKINVSSPSSKITIFSADPASPANTSKVRFHVRTDGLTNFRAMRILVDGAVKYELGATDYFYDWNTSGYGTGDHSIVVEAASQSDTSWSHPERKSMTYSLQGSTIIVNHQPNPPLAKSPYDWYVYYSGSTATLCATAQGDPDGDAISAYYFDIHDSGQNWNSGWVGSDCITTSSLPAYTYQWHVMVKDSRGAISGWSQDFHFTIVNQNLNIDSFELIPLDDKSENVRLKACVSGQGGVGITIRFLVNSATNGTDTGYWTNVGELGVPCFTDVDAPIWRTLEDNSLAGDGQHLVRVEAHGASTSWNGAVSQDKVITLPHRRPSFSRLKAPLPASNDIREAIFLNSRSITFKWDISDRASSYRLSVSLNPSPRNDANPVFRQNYGAGVTQATVNFSQDYAALYWQIEANNDVGITDSGDPLFGIDRIGDPTCSIQSLPEVSYENNFQVHWGGTDSPSGVGSYNIQYLDSRNTQWNDWLKSVPASKTYDLFIGQPGHKYSFRCQLMDNAGNLGAYPSSGYPNITVDPSSRPPEIWWNSGYSSKRNITVQNNMPEVALPANYPVNVRFTSGTTPTAAEIYNLSQSSGKCDDLRIVYDNATELNRYIKKCNVDEIEIWFRTQAGISAGGTSASYQIYIGNSTAINPPADASQIWYPFSESDTSNLYLFQEGSGSTTYDSSGHGRNCTIDPSVNWSQAKWGTGLHFNHANNGTSVSLTCGSPYPLSSLTAEFWFKPDPNAFNVDGRLAGQLGPGGQLSWLFSIESDRMKFERWCNGGSQQARGNINLRTSTYSQWTYLAVTFDGGSQVKFYVNGSLDNTVTLDNSCSSTYNIPLEIGSVEGGAQGQYYIGAFRLSSGVKTNFVPGSMAIITNEPTVAVGTAIDPPGTGNPDLSIESINTYPDPTGGVIVQVTVRNQGNLDTQNGFYTDLYFNHIPNGAGDLTGSLRFWVNDPIKAGETANLTTVVNSLSGLSNVNTQTFAAISENSGTLYAQVDSAGLVNEINKTNNIFSSGTDICIASADTYESDGTSGTASTISVGNTQSHNFNKLGDQDWIKFTALAGQAYSLRTSKLSASADTYLYLYGKDGTTLLASNDDFGDKLSSSIAWAATSSGTYYVLVKHWNPSIGGCGTSYDLTIAIATVSSSSLSVSKSGTGTGIVTSSPAGINCGTDCTEVYSTGKTITLTATASTGSTFTGWSGAGCSGTGTCTILLTANSSVTARFMAPPGAFNKSLPANGAINQPVNLSLSWAASTGAVSYWYCYDKTNDNACSTWVNNGSQTSVGLSNLAPNTKYYWQVRAVNGAGTTYANGTAASFWSLTTGTLPGSFLRTSPANGASNRPLSPTLKWADSTSANSYEYCFDTTNDNTCTTWLNNGTATSKTLSGLTVNTTYYWQVRAVNAVGTTYSGASSTDYWSFRVEAPAAFNKTGPANGATGQPLSLTLEWAASNGAGSYWYCIDTTNDNACSTTWIKNSTFTSILLNNLLPNTTYYWHVRAVNTAGTIFSNGSNNAFWSFITGP